MMATVSHGRKRTSSVTSIEIDDKVRDVDQRQLEYFVAVAEELNFTRAAGRTHAVQSTVSASVRALEREVGARLFDRTTSRVVLTPEGRAFLPEARSALDALAAARQAVDEVGAGLRGRLRVGTLTGLAAVDLPSLAADFRERHPGVDLQLRVAAAGTSGLLDQLRDSALDVAFVGVDTLQIPGITVRPLVRYQPRLLVPAAHPLARRRRVSPDDLADEVFVDLPVGFCNRERTDHDFVRAGISRAVAVEVADLTTIPHYVESGLGVAVVAPLRAEHGRDVVAVPMDPPATSWTLAVATAAAEPSRVAHAFLELIEPHVVDHDRY